MPDPTVATAAPSMDMVLALSGVLSKFEATAERMKKAVDDAHESRAADIKSLTDQIERQTVVVTNHIQGEELRDREWQARLSSVETSNATMSAAVQQIAASVETLDRSVESLERSVSKLTTVVRPDVQLARSVVREDDEARERLTDRKGSRIALRVGWGAGLLAIGGWAASQWHSFVDWLRSVIN